MTVIAILSLAAAHAAAAPPPRAESRPPLEIAYGDGRMKSPTRFFERMQRVQYDGVYSPPSYRAPDPEPGPGVPVRYHTPEELALPIAVKPAPRYLPAVDPTQRQQGTAPSTTAPDQTAVAYDQPGATPPQLSPNPSATSPTDAYAPSNAAAEAAAGKESMSLPPAGSPTGSTATVRY